MSQSFLEIFAIVASVIFFVLIVGGFGYTLHKIGQLKQQIDYERASFEEDFKREREMCDRKIERLTQQLISILRDHEINPHGITLSVDAGGDVDIDGVVSGGSNRSRPETRRGL